MFWKKKLEDDATRSLSEKIKVGARVKHRLSGKLGTVFQTGKIDGSFRLPALSVTHDDGTEAILVPAEDYAGVGKVLELRY